MDASKIIISATVIMILVGFVAVPLIETSADMAGDQTRENAGASDDHRFEKVSSYTASLVRDASGISMTGALDVPTGTEIYLVGDSVAVYGNSTHRFLSIIYYENNTTYHAKTLDENNPGSLAFSGTTWTLTYGENSTATGSFTWLIVPDVNGSYSNTTLPKYIDDEAFIAMFGYNATLSSSVVAGTIKDGLTPLFYSNSTVVTKAEANATPSAYSNYVESITLTLSNSTEIERTTFIFSPIEYTISEDGNIVQSLISLTPVLLIVGLIVGIVGMIFYRRSQA